MDIPAQLSPSVDRSAMSLASQLQECLQLAKDTKNHALAMATYEPLRDRLIAEYPDLVDLLDMMWSALLASHRSAHVWEQICNTEKRLTDRMAESHVQLHQNYLRLVQEQ